MAVEDGAAISGAVHTLRLLADGQVSVTVLFEPQDRVAVMQLLGSPGQPVAVAALKVGHAAVKDKTPDPRGPLCMEAINLCGNAAFQRYIQTKKWSGTADAAKGYILAQCGIESRKALDTNEEARILFGHLRREFQDWVRTQQ